MKQYIDSCGAGVIVALDNRAFVILSPTTLPPISYELIALPNNNTNNNKNKNSNLVNGNGAVNGIGGGQSKKSKRKRVKKEKETDKELGGEDGDNSALKDGNIEKVEVNNKMNLNVNKFGIKYQQETNAIQAVSIRFVDESGVLYCAVSRFDKSISVYNISTATASQNHNSHNTDVNGVNGVDSKATESNDEQAKIQEQGPTVPGLRTIEPMVVHRVTKRSCTLAFATIPSLSPSVTPSSSPEMIVVIAGDMAGDATAFPVQPCSPTSDGRRTKRLLLGHTASMLTSIRLIPPTETETGAVGGRILTADRDEKVRISSFPDTFRIHGYLLGHSAYITDIDVLHLLRPADDRGIRRDVQLCVTASGDGTVRLWDIQTCVELCRIDFDECSQQDHNTEDSDSSLQEHDAQVADGTPSTDTCNPTTTKVVDTSDDAVQHEDKVDSPPSTHDAINNQDENPNGVTNNHEKKETDCQPDSHTSKDATDPNPTVTPTEKDVEHAPVRVSINKDGTILAVMRDGIDRVDLFDIAVRDDPSATADGAQTGALTRIRSVACPSRPLGMAFAEDGSLSILTGEPAFVVRWKPGSESVGTTGEEGVDLGPCAIGETVRNIGTTLNITMPYSFLEANDSTGKVKLRKNIQEEKEGFVKYEPWLSVKRVEKPKQRGLRHKKRKREKDRLLGP